MKTRKSVMTHQFSQVPKAQIQRSTFDRSHGHKTTLPEAGRLYPILVDEVLPGDTFKVNMTAFARMATPIFPIMDNMRMETFFFAVPNRLVWDNWEKFNGEQAAPGDSTAYSIPQFDLGDNGVPEGNLLDYMGVPPNKGGFKISALFMRAYNLIWNEWFRDQNLANPAFIYTGDDDTSAQNNYPIRYRGKRHDYFTSCLPFPQKGDPVSISLGGNLPVSGIGVAGIMVEPDVAVTESDGSVKTYAQAVKSTDLQSAIAVERQPGSENVPNMFVDLSQVSAITINDLREAFQIQRLLERDARGGTRYIEIIKSHFGVTSPDARLQRPEYLGGGSSPVNISPIASTVPTSVSQTTPQGNLAAIGTASLHNHGFTKSFTEHCIIIGLVSVRADLTYQQGLNRMWSRLTRYDFYWPVLAHLGEQAVLNKEIYVKGQGFISVDNEVFGYQERYAEYRYKPSLITGQFRSDASSSLDAWHLSQQFGDTPLLNSDFINDRPPVDRVIAVPSEPHFIFDSYFSMKCTRPMPLYSVPGLIDHF